MSEKDWWTSYGPFKQWSQCPSRPDPCEVLLFFLEKRGIRPEEQVGFLTDLLELQKSMVYNILKGEGLDSVSRCRRLAVALKIHPPLLGLDAKFYPIERHPSWWHSYGFFFNADAQGYPLMSEVVAYLRTQRTQRDEGGRVKVWSQEDLANAAGLKKETIFRMEHDRNPLILESMSRRAIVASALATLSGEKEPTLFRLLGLDPQAYRVPVPAHECISEVHFLPERLTDETVKGYQDQLAAFFREYETGHAQNVVGDALEWLRRSPMLLSKAQTRAQRVNLLALQSRYHKLLAGIAREQCKTKIIQFHADKAVALAEQATTLPNPPLGKPALSVRTNELLAHALLWRAEASYELGNSESSQADIDRALEFLPALVSSPLKVQILAYAGLIHASTAKSEMDRTLVFSYFSLAEKLHAPCQLGSPVPDDPFESGGKGLLYLRKAMALSTPNMKGKASEKVSDLLETAQQSTPPDRLRQHTLIEVVQAKCAFTDGDYGLATEMALSALEKSRLIHSRLNRDRIEELYRQLLSTESRERPLLSYLGVKLRTWDHGLS